jgi:hypothetical protein
LLVVGTTTQNGDHKEFEPVVRKESRHFGTRLVFLPAGALGERNGPEPEPKFLLKVNKHLSPLLSVLELIKMAR